MVVSRREFLLGAGGVAAAIALDACSGGKKNTAARPPTNGSGTTTTTPPTARRLRAGERPDPSKPEGTDQLPQIEHIVVVMMENHSYDNYLGMLDRGDGFHVGNDGQPTNSCPDKNGNPVPAFHMPNTCQPGGASQNWRSTHIQWDNGKMDGFVRSPSGHVAMGYWTEADLPFYYGLART